MQQLLTEIFNIKNGIFKKSDGTEVPIAYIDPSTSENTYQYKDEIKKFNAKWLSSLKTWGWFTNNNPEVYEKYIKPCLQYLTSVEQNPNNEERNVVAIIDRLLSELSSGNVAVSETFNANDLKGRLDAFKRELMSIVSNEEFKEKMLPIIKFRNAQGHQYSFTNAILVYIQDPKATLVKSKTNWFKFNKTIKKDAKAIALWVPVGGVPLTQEEKDLITAKFLRLKGVSSKKELTQGDKEELSVKLKPKGTGFKLVPSFYDVRFTDQIQGKEDLVGGKVDLPWFDDKGEVTEDTTAFCDAVISVIQDRGITIKYTKDLGGSRGVSKSGTIEVLENVPKNSGLFNTLTHEYAHELLHQKYVLNSDKNIDGYGQYFIGTKQGRAVVEQQAELCAWIVLRNFGFDMPTNINYVGMWGMDEKSAPYVFDTVANVSSAIIKDISNKINSPMTESKRLVNEELTGLDVARMIGCEDIYLRNKENEMQASEKRQAFQESFNTIFAKLNNRNQEQSFRL